MSEYRRALQEKKIAEEKKTRELCPGCTSHGECHVAEEVGIAPGEHFWTGFNDEDLCDLCGVSYSMVYP